ncbi:hypothetical protein GCM10028798_21900 [Humibacter antri]
MGRWRELGRNGGSTEPVSGGAAIWGSGGSRLGGLDSRRVNPLICRVPRPRVDNFDWRMLLTHGK